MPLAAIAKLLGDARPAVRDRAIEHLVEKGEAGRVGARFRPEDSGRRMRRARRPCSRSSGSAQRRRAAEVRAALDDADFRVRVAAARCAGMAGDHEAVERLAAMARRDHPAARRQAIAALGQIGDAGAVPALLAAAADPEDRFVEHSVIYSLITLRQAEPVVQALGDPRPKVRKAALIALDQMDNSPLQSGQVARLLRAPGQRSRARPRFGWRRIIRTGRTWC